MVYTFADGGTFTTTWAWYEAGKEQWMEEIKCERAPKYHGSALRRDLAASFRRAAATSPHD